MAKAKGDFGKGSVVGHILRLALPIMAAEVVHVAYNIVDRVYIGHIEGAGTVAITGVGIALPLITFIGAFANLMGHSAAPLATIARGAGDNDKAQRILETGFALTVYIGLVLTVLMYLGAPVLLKLFGGDEETLPYAVSYFRIYVIGTIPTLIALGMNNSITAQGFAGTGMASVIIGAVINIVLDPVFIFTLGMGVQGAAVATIIAQTVSAVWITAFLISKKPTLRLAHFKVYKEEVMPMIKLGVTGFCFKATNSIVQAVTNITLKTFGGPLSTLYIGATSIINSIREVAMIPINGATNGYQPVLSYNYGAKLYKRVVACMKTATCFVFAMNVVLYAALMIFTRPFISIFSEDAALVETTLHCARIFYSMYFMMTFQVIGQNTYVALNMPKYSLFFSMLRKIICVVPLTLILPRIGFGVDGVYYAEAISQLTCSLACFITMYLKVWRPISIDIKEGRKE